jgi:iron complex outermembrane receptor protein
VSKGLSLGDGWVVVTGEYRDRNRTNRAGPDPRDQIQAGDAGNNPVPQPNHWVGDPETKDYLAFLNAQLPAGTSSFVYAFGGWSFRDALAPGFYRRALQFTQNWPQIYPIGFLPLIATSVGDGSGTLGVRGTRGAWYGDLSLQYGRNSMDFDIENTLNASLGPAIPRTRPSSTRAASSRTSSSPISTSRAGSTSGSRVRSTSRSARSSGAKAIGSRLASPVPTRTAGCRRRTGRARFPGRRCSRASAPRTRPTSRATTPHSTWTRRAT